MTPASNPLVPVLVTDKNGVQSIRWKRPASPDKKQTTIPAVQPVAPVLQWDVLRKDHRPVPKKLLNTMARNIKAKSRREKTLSTLAPDTLDILNERYGDSAVIGQFMNDCTRGESLISLNNAAVLIDCADDPMFNENSSSPIRFFRCVAGLREYDGYEDIDYSTLDGKDREEAKALLRSAEIVDSNYRRSNAWKSESPQFLASEHLVSLIRRRPDDMYAITKLLKERNFRVAVQSDIDLIEDLLDTSRAAPQLSDGAL